MKPLKIAICDDNSKERSFFYSQCVKLKEVIGIDVKVKEYENGESLLFDMEDPAIASSVDIVLLDIHMPGRDGMQAASKLREYGYIGEIVFVTKSNSHWRQAFDVKAFNYLTKDEDLEERFMKVFEEAANEALQKRGKVLFFSSVGESRAIEIKSISHFTVDMHWVTVHYTKGTSQSSFQFMSTLVKIMDMTVGEGFVRTYRSCLVNKLYMDRLVNGELVLTNGFKTPVSRRYMTEVKAALAEKPKM